MQAFLKDIPPVNLASAIITNPLTVESQTTVREAIATMSRLRAQCEVFSASLTTRLEIEARSSCVIIIESGKVIGVLTERDIVRLSAQQASLDLPIANIITPSATTTKQSELTDLFAVLNFFQQKQIRHLPILDDAECLIGLITYESLIHVTRPIDLLRLQKAQEVMTRSVICTDPSAKMLEIVQLMAENQISCVVLTQMEEHHQIPVGMITERDLVQFQALELNLADTVAQAVMSTPVFCITPEDSLWAVQEILEKNLIQRVVVTGGEGEVVGIVSQSNLLQSMNPLELYGLATTLESKVKDLEAEKLALLQIRAEEMEQQIRERTDSLSMKAEQEKLLLEIAIQIRNSLDVATILNTTVNQVRRLLKCDRVIIYQFRPDWSGMVIAESLEIGERSILHHEAPDFFINLERLEVYRHGRIEIFRDINTEAMGHEQREMLLNFDIRAQLMMPIVLDRALWGLMIASHHNQPRNWQESEVELLESLSMQVTIALQQSTTYQALQAEVKERQQAEKELAQLNIELEERIAQRTTALQERESRYRALMEGAGDAILVINCQGIILEVNRRAEELFGYSREVLLRMQQSQLYPPSELDIVANSLEYCLSAELTDKQSAQKLETQILTIDGEQIPVEITISMIEIGTIKVIQVIFRDISDRKHAENIIRKQAEEEKLLRELTQRVHQSLNLSEILQICVAEIRSVLNCDRVLVYQFQADWSGIVVAESVADGWKTTLDEQITDSCLQQHPNLLSHPSQPIVTNDIYKAGYTECHIQLLEEYQVKANISVPIQLTDNLWGLLIGHQCTSPREWRSQNIKLLQTVSAQMGIAIQKAILYNQVQTELKVRHQAEQQLTITNAELMRVTRLKDEFLANMSHELRTPLNAILGITEGLQDNIFGPVNPQQVKSLAIVERSASHLLSLINDILDVAKIESGQIDLDTVPTIVSHLCQTSLAFVKQQAWKKRIQLEIKIPLNLPELMIDERRIRQVLINLLTNAVKFTPEGGTVLLTVTSEVKSGMHQAGETIDQTLHFSVCDTGIGIAPENIKKLFQPFMQIDSSLNREHQGTGLGLALVKQIVELHGGSVELTSELGVGSCFSFDLPCTLAKPIVPVSKLSIGNILLDTELTDAEVLEKPTIAPLILLAEDQEANISSIVSYLNVKGYRMLIAHNGEEALSLTQSDHPDLILMDIQMPRMDGLEAMQHIRRFPKQSDVPIIALTAFAMEGDRERCLAAGANEYMSKPIRLKELLVKIQELLPVNTNLQSVG
jgi:PAS domain S-box-containing protein